MFNNMTGTDEGEHRKYHYVFLSFLICLKIVSIVKNERVVNGI